MPSPPLRPMASQAGRLVITRVSLAKVEGRTTRAERAIEAWIAEREADASASLLFDENRANFRRIKTHEL